MARISTYPKDTNISLTDKLLGSDAENSLSTKQFEITDVVSFLRTQNIGSQGPQGPQGVQGNTGAAGAVGPAGLNWQGAWVSGTSYVADDAIGYGGASWFCILATSGTTTPDLDTTHWALLASQGATGPAGVAGPTGAQGIQGPSAPSNGTNCGIAAGPSPYPVLVCDINSIYQESGIYRLPQLTNSDIGKQIVVVAQGWLTTTSSIKAYNGMSTISTNQTNGSVGQVYVYPNDRFRFTYLGSDYWFAEYIWASKLKINNNVLIYNNNLNLIAVNVTTTALTSAELNAAYTFDSPLVNPLNIDYHPGFSVACPYISTGGLMYTKITIGGVWVSSSIDQVV